MFNFAEHLKGLRRDKHITQRQLAESIGVTKRGVRRYESGNIKPNYEALIALADFFNVSLDYLVGRSDNPARLP